MADKNDNWFNRRIEPPKREDREDVAAIRGRIDDLQSQQHGAAESKPPERLIDTFWNQHGHKTDQQAAWHLFYSSLEPHQKQQLWDEYHQIVSDSESASQVEPQARAAPVPEPPVASATPTFALPSNDDDQTSSTSEKRKSEKEDLLNKLKRKDGASRFERHVKPLISATVAMLLFLMVWYNQLVFAQVRQYVSPGATLQGPTIIDPNASIKVGPEPRIIIPKINVDVPVVYDEPSFSEDAIQRALERGVVHYGNTSFPGEPGNNVIVGHSSNNFFNTGGYKFAFVLLDRLQIGDTFILHYEGTRYVYKVNKKQVIEPTDFSLIQPTPTPTTTLITCTPPGTSWNRLVVQAEQISPSPTEAAPPKKAIAPSDEGEAIVPGNAPSLWERLTGGLFGD